MNTNTHLKFSHLIRQAVYAKTGIELHPLGFAYGSVKPDYSFYIFKISHFKKKGLKALNKEIKKIINNIKITEYRCTRKSSERLGVIAHYLSDFFCYVHNESYKGGVLGHLFYEKNLFRHFRKESGIIHLLKQIKLLKAFSRRNTIEGILDDYHRRYSMEKPSYALDIEYALKVCTDIIINILLMHILRRNEKAAA